QKEWRPARVGRPGHQHIAGPQLPRLLDRIDDDPCDAGGASRGDADATPPPRSAGRRRTRDLVEPPLVLRALGGDEERRGGSSACTRPRRGIPPGADQLRDGLRVEKPAAQQALHLGRLELEDVLGPLEPSALDQATADCERRTPQLTVQEPLAEPDLLA